MSKATTLSQSVHQDHGQQSNNLPPSAARVSDHRWFPYPILSGANHAADGPQKHARVETFGSFTGFSSITQANVSKRSWKNVIRIGFDSIINMLIIADLRHQSSFSVLKGCMSTRPDRESWICPNLHFHVSFHRFCCAALVGLPVRSIMAGNERVIVLH